MTIVAHELKASYAFIERNFFLTRRYWGWELAFLVYSVAGALSISLIGADQGSPELLLTLMVGAIFWNYLSVVFSWIAETISVERWEGTLEYTFMAPVRRWSQLLGSVTYAMIYGLDPHGRDLRRARPVLPAARLLGGERRDAPRVFMLLGSFSFVGIGMIAAILPLLYVERGAQMTFVLQSCLLLVSGVYYSIEVLPEWMQVLSRLSPATYVLDGVRAGLVQGTPLTELGYIIWPLIVVRRRPHPVRAVGVRPGRALRQAHRQAEASRLMMCRRWRSRSPPDPTGARLARARLGPGLGRGVRAVRGDRCPAARVIAVHKETSIVRDAAGRDRPAATVSGRFRYDALAASDFPAVGDWVTLEPPPPGAGPTIRRSSRPCFPVGRRSCAAPPMPAGAAAGRLGGRAGPGRQRRRRVHAWPASTATSTCAAWSATSPSPGRARSARHRPQQDGHRRRPRRVASWPWRHRPRRPDRHAVGPDRRPPRRTWRHVPDRADRGRARVRPASASPRSSTRCSARSARRRARSARTTRAAATRRRIASCSTCPVAPCSSTRPASAPSRSPAQTSASRRRSTTSWISPRPADSTTAAMSANPAAPSAPHSRTGRSLRHRLASYQKLEREPRTQNARPTHAPGPRSDAAGR